jgi:hypothetical protein
MLPKADSLYIAMYDIVKNNQRVAKLHLIKTAHRLGEPVIGVLDFSEAVLSTYKVKAFLVVCFHYTDSVNYRSLSFWRVASQ